MKNIMFYTTPEFVGFAWWLRGEGGARASPKYTIVVFAACSHRLQEIKGARPGIS